MSKLPPSPLRGCSASDKRAASELAAVMFPICADKCLAIEYFGAGECEAICPHKFTSISGLDSIDDGEDENG